MTISERGPICHFQISSFVCAIIAGKLVPVLRTFNSVQGKGVVTVGVLNELIIFKVDLVFKRVIKLIKSLVIIYKDQLLNAHFHLRFLQNPTSFA